MADVILLPLFHIQATDAGQRTADKPAGDFPVVQSDTEHIGTNGLHPPFVFVAAEGALDNIGATNDLAAPFI